LGQQSAMIASRRVYKREPLHVISVISSVIKIFLKK